MSIVLLIYLLYFYFRTRRAVWRTIQQTKSDLSRSNATETTSSMATRSAPAGEPASARTTTKEDVLDDGTRVEHTIVVETYPDGSTRKRTVTRRMGAKEVEDEDVGRPMVGLSFKNFHSCCCFVPWAWGKGEEEEEEASGREEGKEEEKVGGG